MKILIQKKLTAKNGVLIIPVFKEESKKISKIYGKNIDEFIFDRVQGEEFQGKRKEVAATYIKGEDFHGKLILVGVGKLENYSSNFARRLGAIMAKVLRSQKIENLSVYLHPEMLAYAEELIQGMYFAQYRGDLYKTKKEEKFEYYNIKNLNLISAIQGQSSTGQFSKLNAAVQKATLIAESDRFVKDLVNGAPNYVDSEYLAAQAQKIAKDNGCEIKILGQKELEKQKFGGIVAVNRGSSKEAKLIVLKYFGAKNKKEKPLVIIGKGVVFDSGGYNLKPSGGIETMHLDMAGAAAVLGTFKILKKLGIKRNIIGITPVVENMVSANAFKPSEVITMYNGKTVEICNTDAEGRLILADAISYGLEMNPEAIITIATLTGAVAVALGDRYAGLLGNSPKLRREIQNSGREVDDLGWPLPLHPDFKDKLDSHIADMKNRDNPTKNLAGSSKGAAFLHRFIGDKKWCHIDIGGTAYTSDPLEYQTIGATAMGLRMLIRFLENQS
ncbi:MAG: leucyl aminopeptidase [Patescibacteria group bacterium]